MIRVSLSALFPALASCLVPESGTPSNVKYRNVNRLDLGNDNTINPVEVTGYDELNFGEPSRLEVSAGGPVLTLRNQIDSQGAMDAPRSNFPRKARSSSAVAASTMAGSLLNFPRLPVVR